MKRSIIFVFCFVMSIALFAGIGVPALAVEGEQGKSCGDSAYYTAENGIVTITGTGKINDRAFYNNINRLPPTIRRQSV